MRKIFSALILGMLIMATAPNSRSDAVARHPVELTAFSIGASGVTLPVMERVCMPVATIGAPTITESHADIVAALFATIGERHPAGGLWPAANYLNYGNLTASVGRNRTSRANERSQRDAYSQPTRAVPLRT